MYVFEMRAEDRTPIDTVASVIGRWSSIAAFASDLGCGYEAARKMRMRNSIPPKYWSRLINLAGWRGIDGVTADALVRVHALEDDLAASSCPVPSLAIPAHGDAR